MTHSAVGGPAYAGMTPCSDAYADVLPVRLKMVPAAGFRTEPVRAGFLFQLRDRRWLIFGGLQQGQGLVDPRQRLRFVAIHRALDRQ